jgi:Sigma-70 region 2
VSNTDEQLLDRLRRGDDAAFETLFLRHYGQVYRVLYSLVGGRELAEDLAQETFKMGDIFLIRYIRRAGPGASSPRHTPCASNYSEPRAGFYSSVQLSNTTGS